MRQFAYGVALFISSACGLIIEIVAGRLLAPYVGMSLYTWTAIIAVVLAGLSVGHWIGGALAPAHVGERQAARRIAAALALAAISSLGSLVLLRVLAGLLLGGALAPIPAIILLTTALFLLPSLFVGIVSPILTKIAIDSEPDRHGQVIGRMFALGTLGSIAGTLAAGYFFISWIGSNGTIIAVAATYAVLALAFAVADPLRLLVVAFLAASGTGLLAWGDKVQAFVSPCSVESDYFCIRVDDFSAQAERPSALMALDHLVHSINDRDDASFFYSPYIHFVDEITKARFGARPNFATTGPSAFFIGGGGFSLPRAWAARFAEPDLVVAELDPAVTRAATETMWLNPGAKGLAIHHQDGRTLLQSLEPDPQFDVVFGDAFHDISIPAHLVTNEFHSEIAKRLNKDGFYVLNVVDSGTNPRFMLSLAKTLQKQFRHIEVWIESEQLGQDGRVTFVVVASQQDSGKQNLVASYGLERSWKRWPDLDLRKRLAADNLPILTDDYAPVDRLMAPLLLSQP